MKEIEDIEFRLKFGSDLGRFDQFWDDNFECRYSRSKWIYLSHYFINDRAPLEIYLRALKGNKNIIHVTFISPYIHHDFFDINLFLAAICDLPWVTSISPDSYYGLRCYPTLPAIYRDIVFIKSTYQYRLEIPFVKDIRLKLDPFSTYIFADGGDFDISL